MAYTKYSLTPANNNAAPPDGAPEGMLPSAVNDTMRDMMAQIRDVGDGIRGGTYTMTAPVITGGSITGVALSGNTLTNPVITGGSINNTTVGATTRSTGAFTTLASNGAATFTAGTASTSTTTGTAVITGGLGVSGRINAANFDGIVGANTAAAGNFTTLGATGVATFSAGTVSAPAITTTGDTNTGIFFPAADTIAFAGGSAETMRIVTNGDVGIGTDTPVALFGRTLQIGNSTTNSTLSVTGSGAGTIGDVYLAGTVDTALLYARTSTPLVFGTNNTERMRIAATGEVGIGTSNPNAGAVLTLAQGTKTYGVFLQANSSSESGNIRFVTSGVTAEQALIGTINGGGLYFTTGSSSTERMRIDSSGNLLRGQTSSGILNNRGFYSDVAGYFGQNHLNGDASGSVYAYFGYNGTTIGTITQDGTTGVLYNVTSDCRLKENIIDAPLGNIDDVKVRSFDWKSDGSHVEYGFIAQELVEVAPYAVHQPSNPDEMMAVDYSKLVPMMIKEIQDLKQRIKTLENK